MKDVCYYRCPICGNVVEMIVDGGVSIMCCGKKMEKIDALMNDGAAEKHMPVMERREGKLIVNVSEVEHPMDKDHHIGFVTLVSGDKVTRVDLEAGKKPVVTFDDVEHGIIYAYCNKHGLWKLEF